MLEVSEKGNLRWDALKLWHRDDFNLFDHDPGGPFDMFGLDWLNIGSFLLAR